MIMPAWYFPRVEPVLVEGRKFDESKIKRDKGKFSATAGAGATKVQGKKPEKKENGVGILTIQQVGKKRKLGIQNRLSDDAFNDSFSLSRARTDIEADSFHALAQKSHLSASTAQFVLGNNNLARQHKVLASIHGEMIKRTPRLKAIEKGIGVISAALKSNPTANEIADAQEAAKMMQAISTKAKLKKKPSLIFRLIDSFLSGFKSVEQSQKIGGFLKSEKDKKPEKKKGRMKEFHVETVKIAEIRVQVLRKDVKSCNSLIVQPVKRQG